MNLFDTCTKLGPPVVQYGPSSAYALISVDSSACGTLSTGAIVGIAIGAAVGGVAVVVGIVLLIKYLTSRQDASANSMLRQQQMKEMVR